MFIVNRVLRRGVVQTIILAAICALQLLPGVAGAASNAAPRTAKSSNTKPTISGTPSTSVTVGSSYNFLPTAADADRNTLGFSIQSKPSWMAFSTASGQLSGTPNASNVGTYSNIVIAVTDGKLTAKLQAFSVAVLSASGSTNSAPNISGTPATSVIAGSTYSFTPATSDANGDSLTFSITNQPAWASFSTSTGRLSGTPTVAQVGTYANVSIKVSDGTASASLPAFTINVGAAAASVGSATLSWTPPTENTDGSSLTDLAGHIIYYGTDSGALNQTIQVSLGMAAYVVEGLTPGTYYFAVKAVTSSGAESALSSIASKAIN